MVFAPPTASIHPIPFESLMPLGCCYLGRTRRSSGSPRHSSRPRSAGTGQRLDARSPGPPSSPFLSHPPSRGTRHTLIRRRPWRLHPWTPTWTPKSWTLTFRNRANRRSSNRLHPMMPMAPNRVRALKAAAAPQPRRENPMRRHDKRAWRSCCGTLLQPQEMLPVPAMQIKKKAIGLSNSLGSGQMQTYQPSTTK